MQSGKLFQALSNVFGTPQKNLPNSNGMRDSSSGFSSSQKHRKQIFQSSFSSSSRKKHNPVKQIFLKQPLQHYEIKNILSDDFCGCETTLETCKRIVNKYFVNVSTIELKEHYQSSRKRSSPISASNKKIYLSQLPQDYPEIYHSHLVNILDHFEAQQMTNSTFILLSWIQFHCKFEYTSFFFFTDLKQSMKLFKYYDKLELELIKHNANFLQQLQYFKNLGLQINSFLENFKQSYGALMIPVTQYAKFLEIVKQKGPHALVELIALFMAKKQAQMYTILKYWTNRQISDLRNYSRFLNWDLFFSQIKSAK